VPYELLIEAWIAMKMRVYVMGMGMYGVGGSGGNRRQRSWSSVVRTAEPAGWTVVMTALEHE
jgi:hypothetical protein